jgi:hypothetical protein
LLVGLLLLAPTVKLAPFERVDFDGDTVRVLLNRRVYILRAVDGVETAKLLAACRTTKAWQTRFRLHLVEVLADLRGQAPQGTVSLVLDADRSGERVTIEKVPLTRDNWRKLFWQQQGFAKAQPPPMLDRKLGEDEARADVAQLDKILKATFAFAGRRKAEAPVVHACTVAELERTIAQWIAPLGDPNTRVLGLRDALESRFLPFTLRPAGKGYVALLGKRLLNPHAPFVRALDARRPEEWVKAAGLYMAHGGKAFARYEGLEYLNQIEALRPHFNARKSGSVWLTLTSADGEVRLRMEQRLSPEPPKNPDRVEPKIQIVEGNVGYLLLPHMEPEEAFERHVAPMLEKLRATRAAVLDLRGNSSSHRGLVRRLLPALLDRPIVYNVASSGADLDDVDLYARDSENWTDPQRAAIDALTFNPKWGSGPWRYGVVKPRDGAYRNPVAVLVDGATRNAAEVLADALQRSGRAILVGEPTGGSDGRPVAFTLKNSRIRVAVSTMASYRPDGKLFLNNSLVPDERLPRDPRDWTGASDAQLKRALERLR